MPEDDVIQKYLAESREHLNGIRTCLFPMQKDGAGIDDARVNRVFRAAGFYRNRHRILSFNNAID